MTKPPSPINISIDDNGIIYTGTNETVEAQKVKKLNIAGKNVLQAMYAPAEITDIAVDKDGNIYVASNYAQVWLYDSFGNLLGLLIKRVVQYLF